MISDHVKGRARYEFPRGIRQGITLHREIDRFTDLHPATAAAKEFFRPAYRLYSAPLVDVVYDHFLANDLAVFPSNTLEAFAQETYNTLEKHADWFPTRFARIFPYMRGQDWLYNYQSREGLGKSLHGLVRRARYLTESATAMRMVEENFAALQETYQRLWADLLVFAKERFNKLV